MSKLLKVATSLLLGFMLLGFIRVASADEYCFSADETGQILVDLEKCGKISQALTLTEQQNENLLKQLQLKDEIIALQEQKIMAMEELGKVRQQIADEQVAAEKKSKWKVGIESFGTGGIVGAIAVAIAITLL